MSIDAYHQKYGKMLDPKEVSVTLPDGRVITFETGRIAKQARGAAVAKMGDAFVLSTVCYGEEKEAELMSDPGIIRNRAKIRASICNSRVFLAIQQEFGSFDRYLYSFTDGKVIRESCGIRTTSPLSDAISKDLKKRGMRFVGSTTIYSYLQAVGVISGHTRECFLGGADGTAPAVSSGRTPVQG